jgi:hypothetical protein
MEKNCADLDITNKCEYIYKRFLDVKKIKSKRLNHKDKKNKI